MSTLCAKILILAAGTLLAQVTKIFTPDTIINLRNPEIENIAIEPEGAQRMRNVLTDRLKILEDALDTIHDMANNKRGKLGWASTGVAPKHSDLTQH